MSIALFLSLLLGLSSAQVGVVSPLAQVCNHATPSVVCVNKYAAVMPYQFFRPREGGRENNDFFGVNTSVPSDPSFKLVAPADFLVFDRQKGLEILGASPKYQFIFKFEDVVHEAPVYVPDSNRIYFARLTPGFLPQLIIDLNEEPPALSEFKSNPPVYAPNGGTYNNGTIYWGASGGNNSAEGHEYRVGLVALDPKTNKTTYLLNNFFGYYFNTIDDLIVHPKTGDIWFTDPQYSWTNSLTDTAPQLPAASYRFRPSTGAVNIVESTIIQPNGIAMSPDGCTLYISDTGANFGTNSPDIVPPFKNSLNVTVLGGKVLYAFDLDPSGTRLSNKRPFYFAQEWVPDGVKVAKNGYVVTATGKGADVLDTDGTLLVRIQTNFTVNNIAFAGRSLDQLWLFGQGGVSRVRWDLQGYPVGYA